MMQDTIEKSQDRIEKSIDLKAPVGRVWRALTDYKEFGQWFRVDLDRPFEVGEVSRGQMTYPGYEHLKWEARVEKIEPQRLFVFNWCPYADGSDIDDPEQAETTVEFKLEPTAEGTRLEIVESGFSAIPDEKLRLEALRRNSGGWDEQVKNITAHVES